LAWAPLPIYCQPFRSNDGRAHVGRSFRHESFQLALLYPNHLYFGPTFLPDFGLFDLKCPPNALANYQAAEGETTMSGDLTRVQQ